MPVRSARKKKDHCRLHPRSRKLRGDLRSSAEHVIIAMGSVNDTIEETIDYLAKQGKKVGV